MVGIDSLPDLSLITIIQHLPWQDRVRVEAVSRQWRHLAMAHGWTQVHSFDYWDYARRVQTNWLTKSGNRSEEALELLERCGNYVISLHLHGNRLRNAMTLTEKCPNMRDVRITNMMIDANLVGRLSRITGLRYHHE